MSNQLLAASTLIIGTTMLLRMGKARYVWITAVPGVVMALTTLYAGYLNVTTNYLPGKHLLAVLSIIIMVLITIVLVSAFRRWYELLRSGSRSRTGMVSLLSRL